MVGIGSAVSGGLNLAGKPQINADSPPPMKTLVYSPSARIIIARGSRQYDVSGDLVSGGVLRPSDAVANLQFTLNNKELRYNGLFDRMDRVILFLKRIKVIQVFSGYLDDVPYLQLFPGTVTFRASCTMKRLQHTWWDPAQVASQALFQNAGGDAAQVVGDGTTSGGIKPIGSIIRDLLTQVGGWDPDQIHIENFPMKFLDLARQWMAANAAHDQQQADNFLQLMLGDDHSGGVGATSSANPALTLGPQVVGAPNYIATMIRVCDSMGLGPSTSDLQLAQNVGQAAQSGQSSMVGSQDPGWPALQAAAQNWQDQYRNTDAAILALACTMVETNPGPRILANPSVPESYNFPHDGEGSNGTSVGMYQQISGGQWGDVAQRMNAEASTRAFYIALNRIDWKNMEPGAAIQAVQGSSYPGRYTPMVAAATATIRAMRADMSSGKTTLPTNSLSPASLIGTAQDATSLVPNLGPIAGGGSSPSSASQLVGAGKPSPDAMQAIAAGLSYVGSPYDQIRPPVRGVGVDCSGLTSMAYRSIGIDIGGNTYDQLSRNRGREVSAAQIQPGDICFPSEGHTFMWLGNGYPGGGGADFILESSGSDWSHNGPSSDGPRVKPNHYNLGSMIAIFHIADFGGWDPTVKYNEPSLMGPGYSPGTFGGSTTGTGASALGAGGNGQEPIARNLFTYQFNYPAFAPKIAAFFDGERSLIECEPLIQMVQALCKATLRSWCSSPTGHFVAWYPDYFGLDGKQAVMNIEDIEMKDVSINLNDYSLITHAYVATGYATGESMGPWGWLQSGVATVENEALFQQMIKVAPNTGEQMTGADVLARFGARPFMKEYTMVQSTELRQLLAIHHFMEGWANQFATNVQFTFMPELFPGMRLNLVSHNLQVYVTQVQHTFDYAHGFSTQATITAPSIPNGTMQVNQAASLSPNTVLEKSQDLLKGSWFG